MSTEKQSKWEAYKQPVILIACVLVGAVLGIVLGDKAAFLYPIGQIWLNMLFVLLVPLIFFSISSSIAAIGDTRRVGKLLIMTIAIFIITAAIAGTIMFIVTAIFKPDTSITIETTSAAVESAEQSIGDQIVNTFTVSDFPDVITRAHILPLIVFTVFFGMTVSTLGEKGRAVSEWLANMSTVFYQMVNILMKFAPIGLACYFANLTGTYGRGLLIYYPTMLAYFFIFLGLYAFVAAGRWGVQHFFKEIFVPALTSLGTRSSAAALPLQLRACDNMNVPREVSSVVCPMGATMHMDGACLATVYEIVLCCALFNHPLNGLGDYAYALVIAVAASIAVSSVPGGGAAMETMLISSFGFPSAALPILIMMTQLFDPGCTLVNSCGDTVASMMVSRFLYGKNWYKRAPEKAD